MTDGYDLQRFVDAQAGMFDAALAEIGRGAKQGHWMWFVFPQIAGLGRSATARHYAISSIGEARAYLAHPLLGPRYGDSVAALQVAPQASATAVFGAIDAMKLRSSLTLFAEAGDVPLIDAAIGRWFAGERDAATLRILSGEA